LIGSVMKVSEQYVPESPADDYGLENALAAYVRRRWPENTVKHVMGHFDLTDGLARGVVYATATRRGLNQCVRKGGWSLWLILGAMLFGHALEIHIERERERERKSWERVDRSLGSMGERLRSLSDVGRDSRS
jgi:hypothetical protein